MSSTHHRLRLRVVGLLAIVPALAVGYLLLASGGSTSVAAQASAAPPQPAAAVSSASGTFAVFSRPSTAKDNIAGWRVATRKAGDGDMDFARARIIYQDAKRAVAAVPTRADPCLVTQLPDGSGGFTCSPSFSYGNSIGLVPDSVKSVSFTMTDGTTQEQDVTDNYWRSPSEATKVTYVVDGQTTSLELMPLSSLPKGASISPSGVVSNGSPLVGEAR